MVQVRHMGKLLAITLWGTLLCVSHFLLQQRISCCLRCCLEILAPDSISRHLSQLKLFLQLSLSYKPQHTSVEQQYHLLCHHLDTALAVHFLLLIVELLINVDCFHLGFAATNSPTNVVP